jgi:hypothetical protein
MMGRGQLAADGRRHAPLAAMLVLALLQPAVAAAAEYFTITVVDEQTGRGVPLVELRTVNNIRYYTDSNGVVAFYEPGLMGQDVFFHVSSHGYEYPKDGFGYRGQKLKVTEGGSAVLRIKRINIAARLYRVTGGGIYRDSVLVGHSVPIEEPVLNGLVFGQDSVVNTIYHGKIYWFWGDTSWPAYPLGNFQVAGATSRLPGDGGLPPDVGVDLTYFVDERGFAKQMAPIPGEGPTWIDGLVTLRDEHGGERMFAVYSKVRQDMTAKERGLLQFDDAEEQFKKVAEFDVAAPIQPGGHTFRHSVDGVEYVYYTRPFPVIRVRADPACLTDLSNYEAFTCLSEGSSADELELDREGEILRWAWKRNAPPLIPREQETLIKAGKLKPSEARFRLCDVATGQPVIAHGASVYWNEYRRRWLMIVLEIGGTSMLGEVWVAEADTPLGPWLYATKIVTHDRYSFYNPKHHPMFDQDGGRVVYFEATYSSTFSGNPDHTPRYDYNQIMYRLDLSDPRLVLPVPVYPIGGRTCPDRFGTKARLPAGGIDCVPAFLALERSVPNCVAVYERKQENGTYALELGPIPSPGLKPADQPVFYALPAESKEPPPTTTLLYELTCEDGRRRTYATDVRSPIAGYRRAERPLCRVWRNPRLIVIPTAPSSTP